MMYTREDLVEWVGSTTYARGLAYWREGRVKELEIEHEDGDDIYVSATVRGGRRYRTSFVVHDGCLSSSCDCPVELDCKHGVALALDYLEMMGTAFEAPVPAPAPTAPMAPPPVAWQAQLAGWRQASQAAAPADLKTPVFRLGLLGESPPSGRLTYQSLYLWIGRRTKSHGLKPQAAFTFSLEAIRYDQSPAMMMLGQVLQKVYYARIYEQRGTQANDTGWLRVAPHLVDALLGALSLMRHVEDEDGRPLDIVTAPLRLALAPERSEAGTQLRPVVETPGGPLSLQELTLLGEPVDPWVWLAGRLQRLGSSLVDERPFLTPIQVPADDQEAFERRVWPTLAVEGRLVGVSLNPTEVTEGHPEPQLLLSEQEGALHGEVGFLYGADRVAASDDVSVLGPAEGPWMRRDPVAEESLVSRLRWALDMSQGAPLRWRNDEALEFLVTYLPKLEQAGWQVLGRDDLVLHRLITETPSTHFSVKSGIDWFDVEARVDVAGETVPWPALLQALFEDRRYVRLGSGAFAKLPTQWLRSQQRMLARLDLDADQLGEPGGLRLMRYHAPAIAHLAEAADQHQLDPGYKTFLKKLEGFGGIAEAPLPVGFTGELRDYQRQGLNFLTFLGDYGLGGILADDMGLGKTVQAAALLAARHADGKAPPSLVIAPTSVVGNWVRELARFAPGLRVLLLHGPDRDPTLVAHHDVVVTTYATARLDETHHLTTTYTTLLLDEAQFIKNPASQTALSLRRLKAVHRLCLTGTPIENHLFDLWSLFSFLMPGFLGKQKDFRERYLTPISQGDDEARRELKARVAPFILRRLKSQVATELPPRTDITVWCELPPAQRRAYDALLATGAKQVRDLLESQGLARSRITVLAILTKLRQLCCHPALLKSPETLHLPSGKLDAALALIQEVVDGGHRALVFSQFTQMLAVLRERLDAQGIAYTYLDGATRNRQAKVDAFNQGDVPLFLISLKAGGTGLNLTGADYVIHYDLWWNPAVEDQATDRAHRIGQTRQVFNYKLVARNTIEEKLLALQERKRGLVRDLLDTDALGKQLTRDDLLGLFEG